MVPHMKANEAQRPLDRIILIVLDSVGCGAAPDASSYGDEGADTLGNLSRRVGSISLPNLGGLGLGHVTAISGVLPTDRPRGFFGRMREASAGKDTTTGHWELCGLTLEHAFPTFPNGFPEEMLARFRAEVGHGVLGNRPASGTEIIEELGPEHLRTSDFIVYTSADSVFQIAAHEDIVPLPELYRACEVARRLCDERGIGRVIARPFVGKPGAFRRTYNRRDFAMPPAAKTVLDHILAARLPVVGIGKIWDIFAGHGVRENIHTEGNRDGMEHTLQALEQFKEGLIFVNLVDFDMLYGHRRDPAGYAHALVEFDGFLPALERALSPRDLVLVTADHGNDPTFPGTDHTREDVPILAFGPGLQTNSAALEPVSANLGVRHGFYDVAQTLCAGFGLPAWPRGQSFLPKTLLGT